MKTESSQELLNRYDIKLSMQRLIILDYLLINRIHPTIDDIYMGLKVKVPTMSKTTIYNTMKLFMEKGLVIALNIDEKNVRYDIGVHPHAHFKCKCCGMIKDIPLTEEQMKGIPTIPGMKIEETHIYYYGLCENCININ